MKNLRTKLFLILAAASFIFPAGCKQPGAGMGNGKTFPLKAESETTIGDLTEVFSPQTIPVEGYALVGELNGKGSSQCPPSIRQYLKQYILKQLSDGSQSVDHLINSHDTAVVLVRGQMPASALRRVHFDLKVVVLPETQTTSLEGGILYGAELKAVGSFGLSVKTLASAQGPIYIDKLVSQPVNPKVGYILNGGTALNTYGIRLELRQPDFAVAGFIRDLLNKRFGGNCVKAVSKGMLRLQVPDKYKRQKDRFIDIVKLMYLRQGLELNKQRIMTLATKLAVSPDKKSSEAALEAIGKESADKLIALLNSSNEEVRLRAGRCLLNMGVEAGFRVLRQIALDATSMYRQEALEALSNGAGRRSAAVLRELLSDSDTDIKLSAYEELRKLDDISISKNIVGNNFLLEEIAATDDKMIYVSRSGQPRIALFGAPVFCRDNIFIQSQDGDITLNAAKGQQYLSVIRRHPQKFSVNLQLRSNFNLSNIIRTLCDKPSPEDASFSGLGVSYADAVAILQKMCNKGVVEAEFQAGPLPKIGLIVKK